MPIRLFLHLTTIWRNFAQFSGKQKLPQRDDEAECEAARPEGEVAEVFQHKPTEGWTGEGGEAPRGTENALIQTAQMGR